MYICIYFMYTYAYIYIYILCEYTCIYIYIHMYFVFMICPLVNAPARECNAIFFSELQAINWVNIIHKNVEYIESCWCCKKGMGQWSIILLDDAQIRASDRASTPMVVV